MARSYQRRVRVPSCAPIIPQNAIAAPYQIAMKGMESLEQLNAYATAPRPPAAMPAKPPDTLSRVGAPVRTALVSAINGMIAKKTMLKRQRTDEILVAPRSISSLAGA